MNVLKYFVLSALLLSVANVSTLSADEGQKSTPIAQINGVDVVVGEDTVIAESVCINFTCSLREAGVSFIAPTTLYFGSTIVLFSEDDRGKVCSIGKRYGLTLNTSVGGIAHPCLKG